MRPRIAMRFAQLLTGSMRPRPLGARCASIKMASRGTLNLAPLDSLGFDFAGDGRGVDFGPPLGIGRQTRREHQLAEVVKRPHVHPPLEIDDFADRSPIVGPAPAVELRRGGGIES